ncbi:MAG TPA: hypothetical protein VLB44_17820, partial [Kofleriaceae bacterium]|nr:hypothetical protein [Kofleriaceae bacterium]
MQSTLEHSRPVVFPPVIPVSGFLLGVILNVIYPAAQVFPRLTETPIRLFGAAVFCLGASGFAWMV